METCVLLRLETRRDRDAEGGVDSAPAAASDGGETSNTVRSVHAARYTGPAAASCDCSSSATTTTTNIFSLFHRCFTASGEK